MDIKILGAGCARCKKVEEDIKKAVSECGVDAKVEQVTDIMNIAEYGVMGTPAVVIDGTVKSVGKVPALEEIKSWICRSRAEK